MKLAQLEYSPEELMSEDSYESPLYGGDVLCHGGYINDQYVSPRGKVRRPAIEAWRTRLTEEGQPLIQVPDAYVPPHYPNYEQAKYLMKEGLVQPVSRSLTTISILEGFGARIRDVALPDFDKEVVEDLSGTALAHLEKGLFEAHARDEAGHRDQGGHKQMWEAARDVGLDKPDIPGDVLMRLMGGGTSNRKAERIYPELSAQMEQTIISMANILVVETFAEDVFAWAMELLGDEEVSADPKLAAHLVDCVRIDEKPHVDYLTVALSELRSRTLISQDGKKTFEGSEVVDHIFSRLLRGSATNRPKEARERLQQEIHGQIQDVRRAEKVSKHFESLDSGWTFPVAKDEQLEILTKAA